MNRFLILLNYFAEGEKITHFFLINKPFITEELINEAEELGLIIKTDYTSNNDVRYSITPKGVTVRNQ